MMPQAPQPPRPGSPSIAPPNGQGADDAGLSVVKEMGGQEGKPFESMVLGINTALTKMQELLSQEQAIPPEALQELQGIQKAYQQFLVKLSNSGQQGAPDEGPPEPGASERVPMESGGRGVPVP